MVLRMMHLKKSAGKTYFAEKRTQTGEKMKSFTLRMPILFGYLLLFGITIVYCILIWYAGNLFSVFIDKPETMRLPLATLLFIMPLPMPFLWAMLHWQLLAVLSLAICFSWGLNRSKFSGGNEGHALPMVIHTAWIIFAVCGHMLGAIVPFLMVGHVIK